MMHITNQPAVAAFDGGSSRETALARFLADRGAEQTIVMDAGFKSSRFRRPFRLARLKAEVRRSAPGLVVVNYPSYPFFWQYKLTKYFWNSVAFGLWLRAASRRMGFKIVADVMDLPTVQYKDLGYGIEMKPATLGRFERFVLRQADYLWVCSASLAQMINQTYGVDESKIIVALNGYGAEREPRPAPADGPLKYAYAGSLNKERGIEPLLEAFLASANGCELHMCGPFGDWIPAACHDARIVYHGALTDSEAAEALSDCHMGLIPYPERGYYHLALATKLAFYLGMGLPVLCSNARETAAHVKRLGIGLCWSMDDMASALDYVSQHPDELASWRQRVLEVRDSFAWSSIYARALDETLARSTAERGPV